MAAPSRRHSSTMFPSTLLSLICLLYIFSSTALAVSAVLGVDLGTEYIKAALVKPGIPLEIVLTKDSRRKETSAVAFKTPKTPQMGIFPERVYGSDAVALAARFPGDVYPNLKSLLGLPADNSVVKEYASRHPSLRLEAEKTRGTAAFRSAAFMADEELWTVEEILAMELQTIQKNAEALAGKGSVVKNIVLTVPVFYTAEEKRAVELAAELAGLKVLGLMSDGLAVGLNYATTRTFPSVTDGGKPEYHMVFDMGAGSTKATILRFQGRTVKDIGRFNKTIQEVHALGSGWDRTLGGDALNAIIMDDMIAKFVASPAAKSVSPSVEAVQGHGRAIAKLWKEAERLRQVLSANADTQASFEGLYEDIDFRYKISRADFEKLAESHASRVGVVVQKALEMADLTVEDLNSVILHGGAIRTPFVQKELEKIVGNPDKIRGNVNSDEAAVFGAGFKGAELSPSFRVKDIRTFEGAVYAAGIKWENINEKPQHQRLWQPTSYLGAEKQYSFKNQKEFTIKFYQHVASSENVSPGSAEKELLAVTTKNLTESVAQLKDKFGCTDGDIFFKVSTRLSPSNGEVEIVKAFVDCEVDDAEEKATVVDSVKGLFGFGKKDQIPLSEDNAEEVVDTIATSKTTSTSSSSSSSGSASPSAAEPKDSKDNNAAKNAKDVKAKPTKHIEVINVKYATERLGLPQLRKANSGRMKARMDAFDDSDRSRTLREELLNQLEGFTYKTRDLLDDADFIAASTDAERVELEAKYKASSDWIYSGGADATRDELKARLNEMKDIVQPIEQRREEAASRPEKIKMLQDTLNETKSLIETIQGRIENDTIAHSSFSAAKASSSSSTTSASTPTMSITVEDDFAGLEDEEATTTTSAEPEEETLAPPEYTTDDLVVPQASYDSISAWLSEKLTEQEKLPKTADPVLTVKDIVAKDEEMKTAVMALLMKGMNINQQNKPKKPTVKKPATKPKKPAKSKGKKSSAEPMERTVTFGKDGQPMMKLGDDEFPIDEDMLAAAAAFEQSKAERAAEAKANKDSAGTWETMSADRHDEL